VLTYSCGCHPFELVLCLQVRDSHLSTADALRYLELLLLSDSGRALLLRSGMLQKAVPLLQQRACSAAAAAAVAAEGQQQWGAVLEALQSVLLYARAAVHVLSQGLEQEPSTLATGACSREGHNTLHLCIVTASTGLP
jgi:hypothetical protein